MKVLETLFGRIRLENLIAILTIAAVVVATASLMLVVHYQLNADVERKALESQQLAVRIGAELLSKMHPGTEVVWSDEGWVEKVIVETVPADKDHALVDSATRMTGEPITIFSYDKAADDFIRVSTTVRTAEGRRANGTLLGKTSAAYASVKKAKPYNGAAEIFGTAYFTIYFPIVDRSENVVGILFAGTKQASVYELAASLEKKILLVTGALLVVMAIVGLALSRMLTRPIPALAAVMARLTGNDTNGVIPFTDFSNEIGEMARAVAVFRDNTIERTRLESERARETERREARQKTLEVLIEGFKADAEQTIAAVAVMAEDLERTAGGLQTIAAGTNDKAQLVASASDQASANVGTVAAASEQLTASIAEISNQISEALNNVGSTSAMAATSSERMSELLASAQQIGEVVTLIREIAGQTNLLALNATIEAARAGEAGRGFAVVATEVKTLATRTAQATESISEQVASIQAATDQAVHAIGEIADRMGHVNGITSQIAAAVTEQGAATSEINASVHHAAADTRHVSETIAGVTEAATTTFNSARQVLETSAKVTARTKALSARIESFLSGVAAA
jgi:methyl-accepting chemotaxis protein